MAAFEELRTVKKGNIGEQIVDNHLIKLGVVPYRPIEGKAHPFDRLCASGDKKTLFVAEVKTKARRNYYPDTGIDYVHFHEYVFVMQKYNIDIYLYFVDELLGKVYGGWLSHISKPLSIRHNGKLIEYPLKQGKQIYFPLALMEDVCELNDASVAKLKELSTRSYDYEPVQQPLF